MKDPQLPRTPDVSPADSRRPWLARRFRRVAVSDGTATLGEKWRDLLGASVVVLAIPYVASVFLPLGFAINERVDPAGYWFLPTVHQIIAALLAIVAIRLVSVKPLAEWGFNLRHAGKSLAWVAAFIAITAGPIYLLAKQQAPSVGGGTVTTGAIVAVLSTHFFVIGTTQEILYRGFLTGFLERQWGQGRLLGISHAGWWAIAIFVISHIKPYAPYIWPAQLGYALFYGVLYALMYQSTRSLLGPSLAHGFSNAAHVALLMVIHT